MLLAPSKSLAFAFALLLLAPPVLAQPNGETGGAEPNSRLSQSERVFVRGFRFEGNTVFRDAELSRVTLPYAAREVSAEELEQARRALTLLYVSRGYVNSGAVLREQDVRDGFVLFTLVEGALSQIEISGHHRYQTRFLRREIERGAGRPFNVSAAREALQVLRQNPNIARIEAEVRPGIRPGQASLRVVVEEADPVKAALEFDNARPASIGAERLRFISSTTNLTGRDDALSLRAGLTRDGLRRASITGGRDIALSYRSPSNARRVHFEAAYSITDAGVIEEPFATLDISSKSRSLSVGLRRVLSRTTGAESNLGLLLERRASQTFLAGEPFSFSRGDVNGRAATTALRLESDALRRQPSEVLAGRAVLSLGLRPGERAAPNGRFFSVLAQAQYVRVLNESGRQLILRAGGQWANRPLLSVEQFALGGASSVRGYRENQLVRDRALLASAELRLPIAFSASRRQVLALVPFVDFGIGSNVALPGQANSPLAAPRETLASAGLGLIYTPGARLNAQLFFGRPLRRIGPRGNDLQDKGLHFSLVYNLR